MYTVVITKHNNDHKRHDAYSVSTPFARRYKAQTFLRQYLIDFIEEYLWGNFQNENGEFDATDEGLDPLFLNCIDLKNGKILKMHRKDYDNIQRLAKIAAKGEYGIELSWSIDRTKFHDDFVESSSEEEGEESGVDLQEPIETTTEKSIIIIEHADVKQDLELIILQMSENVRESCVWPTNDLRTLATEHPSFKILIAKIQATNKIVGFLLYSTGQLQVIIRQLTVAKEFKFFDIGNHLLQFLIQEIGDCAQKENIFRTKFQSKLLANQRAAIDVYLNNKFYIANELPHFYSKDKTGDAIVLSLDTYYATTKTD